VLSIVPKSFVEAPTSLAATVIDRRDGSRHPLSVAMPGRHNLSNALAAIAGAHLAGVPVADAVRALATFTSLARRFDIIGTRPSGITVIDDFGHNPEKCAATLRALKRHPGRILAFFQPHGFGPLRQMGAELAQTFASELGPDDLTLMCDPLYFGGSVERDDGAARVIRAVGGAGGRAEHFATREEVADRIVEIALPGDRIAVMGARDDTLTEFARGLLARLP
jgi:UDP-N-acetylmuramate--alanine ligase